MAVRISGVTLPQEKRIEAALRAIFGIGLTRAQHVLAETKIHADTRTKDLSEKEVNDLRTYIEKNFRVEGDLKREVLTNIKRLKEINSYRGTRHTKGLPSHGQRTRTNSRTVRGNTRHTMGSGKRKAAEKT
ncbi:MAG: 30S ribosomal protein S13 [Patescibacteria group bacterium]|jgi:small subunit ribosomal protein S13